MSNRISEWVLCAHATDLPPEWLPEAGATPLTESALFTVLDRVTPRWVQRDQAERDETFKQWIPLQALGSEHWPMDRFELWSQLAFLLLSTPSR